MAQYQGMSQYALRNQGQEQHPKAQNSPADPRFLAGLKCKVGDPEAENAPRDDQERATSQAYSKRQGSNRRSRYGAPDVQTFDTNPGSIDESSTVMGKGHNEYVMPGEDPPTAQALEDSIEIDRHFEGENHLHGPNEVIPEEAAQNSEALHRGGRPRSRGGQNLPAMKGDSYPDTTSGQPSLMDPNEQRQVDLGLVTQDAGPAQAMGNPSSRGRRVPGVPPTKAQAPHVQSAEASLQQQLPEHGRNEQSTMATRALHQNGAGDFVFGPAPKSYNPQSRSTPGQRQVPDATKQKRAEPPRGPTGPPLRLAQAAPRQNSYEAGPREDPRPAVKSSQQVLPDKGVKRKQSKKTLAANDTSVTHHRGQPKTTFYTHESDPLDPIHAQTRLQERLLDQEVAMINNDYQEMPTDQAMKLDYEPDELHGKAYEDLRNEPFDHDPNAAELQIEDLDQYGDLSQKLDFLSQNSNPDAQSEFMRSLSLGDWENAGDWFLERFGNFLQQLKEMRREKRSVAAKFENELAKRHDAITKKSEQTQAALNVMKESGGKVLQPSQGLTSK